MGIKVYIEREGKGVRNELWEMMVFKEWLEDDNVVKEVEENKG